MATLGDMTTWVSKRLQDPNNTAVAVSDVVELINSASSFWQNTRFWFNEVTDTTTLTQNDNSIPIPTNWLVPSRDNCFVLEYSGIRYPLKKVEEIYYNQIYLSNGTGQPYWFSRQANTEYKCYPIPDQAYTIRRFYLKNYPDLVNITDSDDFSNNATNLIQYTAAAYGSRDFRQDAAMYQAFWAQAQSELKSLLATTRKDNATGSLTLTSVL